MNLPTLEDIKPPAFEPSKQPDDWAKKEQALLKIKRLEAEIESLKNDTEAKKTYASKIYWLASVWLSLVLLMLTFQGFGWGGWRLADSVLISLVAGSTTGVLGLMASVLAYIFRAARPAPKKS